MKINRTSFIFVLVAVLVLLILAIWLWVPFPAFMERLFSESSPPGGKGGSAVAQKDTSGSVIGLMRLVNVPGNPVKASWQAVKVGKEYVSERHVPVWMIVGVLEYKDFDSKNAAVRGLPEVQPRDTRIPPQARVAWLPSWMSRRMTIDDGMVQLRRMEGVRVYNATSFFKSQFKDGVVIVPPEGNSIAVFLGSDEVVARK